MTFEVLVVWSIVVVAGTACGALWAIAVRRAWKMPAPPPEIAQKMFRTHVPPRDYVPPLYIESDRRDDYADPPAVEPRPCGQCLMFMPDNPAQPDAEQWGKCAVRKISVTRRMHVVLKIGEPTCFTTEALIHYPEVI